MVAMVCTLKKNASSNDPGRALLTEPGAIQYSTANSALAPRKARPINRKNSLQVRVST